MLMAPSKELVTVEIAQAWLRVTEAEREKEWERTRSLIVDRVLSEVLTRVRWGRSVQGAADEVWQARGKNAPCDVKQLVAETLEAIGWSRQRGGANSD